MVLAMILAALFPRTERLSSWFDRRHNRSHRSTFTSRGGWHRRRAGE